MKTLITRITFTFLFLYAPIVLAECPNKILVEAANYVSFIGDLPEEGETQGVDSLFACDQISNHENLIVSVFAIHNDKLSKKKEWEVYDLAIVVINKNNGTKTKLIKSGLLESNAIQLRNLFIDTAKYNLNKNNVVFGVRAFSAANSHAYAYDDTTLNLFNYHGNKLTHILDGFVASRTSGNIGESCASNTFETTRRVLKIKSQRTNGMNDIEIIQKKSDEITPDNCEEVDSKIVSLGAKKVIMKFDGKSYQIPKDMKN